MLNGSHNSSQSSFTHGEDGCVVLGSDINRGNRYVTRYRIDREKQVEIVRDEVHMKECVPCLVKRDKRRSAGKLLWDIFRGEAFLLTLHTTITILGAVKVILKLHEVDEDIELLHSCLETIASTVILIIRFVAARHGFKEIKEYRSHMEIHADEEKEDGTILQLRKYVRMFQIVSVFLGTLNVLALLLLIFIDEGDLGWTIITNNITLIVVMALDGQVSGMMGSEMHTLREDQHKAVVYETLLLMAESNRAADKSSREHARVRTERFCKALRDTSLLQRPEYVTCSTGVSPDLDLITTMQVVSGV